MTAYPQDQSRDNVRMRRVWTLSALAVFVAHLAIVVGLTRRPDIASQTFAGAPIAMFDFAPVATSPEASKVPMAPGPPQAAQARVDAPPIETKPMEPKAEEKPPPAPPKDAVVLPKPEPPKPEVRKTASAAAVEASAPPPATHRAPQAAGPLQGESDGKRQREIAGWQLALVQQINKFRHFVRGANGLAVVTFTIDREGHLIDCRVLQSSGNPAIDAEAVANIKRASPLPRPPASVDQSQLAFSLPLRYETAQK